MVGITLAPTQISREAIPVDDARLCTSYNVPQYTSYPTAADFTPMVAAKKHAVWPEASGQRRVSRAQRR